MRWFRTVWRTLVRFGQRPPGHRVGMVAEDLLEVGAADGAVERGGTARLVDQGSAPRPCLKIVPAGLGEYEPLQ
jgi:hypothetical protein